MAARDIVVVGGGAAGILVVSHLARAATRPTRVVVVDAGPGRIGSGTAYRTPDPTHSLNVRAGSLSAAHEDPSHFVTWLDENDKAIGRDGFASRATYGDYLATVAREASTGPNVQVEHVRCRVTDLIRTDTGWRVLLEDGSTFVSPRVVLATGVTKPSTRWTPPGLTSAPRFIADPWEPGALARIDSGEVFIVGAGLTAVDIALSVAPTGLPITMISRHGLLPTAHTRLPRPPMAIDGDGLPTTLAGARRMMRQLLEGSHASTGDWRPAIDGLRPHTSRIWASWSMAEQAEFLRDDVRQWEVYRHRMAPDVADRIAELRACGQLTVVAGDAGSPALDAIARGAWVVNATGPDADLREVDDVLLSALFAAGTVAPGPHGIGLDTDADGQIRDATGTVVPGLFTLGSTRRGQLWESTAIPEIRTQAYALAQILAAPGPRRIAPRTKRDVYGLPLATTSVAAAHYNEALIRVLRVQGGAGEELQAALAEDPGFTLGHAALALLAHEGMAEADPLASLARAEATRTTDDQRTSSFVSAVAERIRRRTEAPDEPLIAHVEAFPLDALAVSACVPTIAFGGATDVPARAWSIVESLAPAYGNDPWYLSMLAFVRQEQHRWAEAATLADRALGADPASGHAVHARAHVFYETGDHEAGLQFIDRWMSADGQDAGHRAHFAWHAALHELAMERPAAALGRFERQLSPPMVTGVRALVDAGSLLWRNRLAANWPDPPAAEQVLAAVPPLLLREPSTAFVAMHVALTLAAAGDREGLSRVRQFADQHPRPVFRDVVAPLANALDAYLDGRYDMVAEILGPLTAQWCRLGGSDAQREVIEDTLISALMRAGRLAQAQAVLIARSDRRLVVA